MPAQDRVSEIDSQHSAASTLNYTDRLNNGGGGGGGEALLRQSVDSPGLLNDESRDPTSASESPPLNTRPQPPAPTPWIKQCEEEQVVISGISGRLPESDNLIEFADHLYNKEDMVTEDSRRWRPGILGMPTRNGKLKDISKFDARYFGVTPKQADLMDPQMRILQEVVHEALVDAGIDPQSVRGSRTGVFVGCSASETEAVHLSGDPDQIHGYTLIGCARSMFANRISYAFDFRGPSFAIDTACSSSLLGLNLALDSIRLGHCDQAVVAGTMLQLMPANGLTFKRLGMMSQDGKSRSFDTKANGYVKAEGIVAIFLQKKPNAKRVYCKVVHAKSNTDGHKSSGITVPNGEVQAQLLRAVYREAGVDPATVSYFEAHGTGTMVGDPQECHAIHSVVCENREQPLLIGSVKSNMGHCEPTSGLASLAKVVLSMERGMIPPNLWFEEPNPYIPGLMDGSLQVVTESTPFNGGFVGLNSFGFGGANTHVLLQSNTIESTIGDPLTFPKLVCYSAPSAAGVERMFDEVEKQMDNYAFHALVSEQASAGGLNPNPYRGYLIFNRNDNAQPIRQIEKMERSPVRPIWFVYTGMGSQWPGMAKQLIESFELFKSSIMRCSETLRPLGLDPFSLIMNGDKDVYSSTLNCMVCNCAIQLALTDLLRAMGVEPSGIFGHSTGEIACGYADGCLTQSQAIMCAYYRGKSVLEAGITGGAMAAVGLTWEEAANVCPEGVVPACHNAEDSVTISGEYEKVMKVVDELKAKGTFAKMVDSAGMPFHSPFMKAAEKDMLRWISSVIPSPKRRSNRWISTCFAENQWDSPEALECSAAYQVKNAMNSVLFHQATQKIPEDAIVIEIAPHALLQSILRRSTASTVTNIGLLKAKQENECEYLLNSLGKLHLSGASMKAEYLYDAPKFPVPRGTPMLAPLMEWEHSESWNVVCMDNWNTYVTATEYVVEPLNPDSPDNYLIDHVIDGRNLFPFTGHILLAWKGLCKIKRIDWDNENPPPLIVEDFEVLRPTIVSKHMKFTVVTTPGGTLMEIYEGGELTAKGNVHLGETRAEQPFLLEDKIDTFVENAEGLNKTTCLHREDIYKMLQLRGYDYLERFQGIDSISLESTCGIFYWDNNWVTFLDAFLQYCALGQSTDALVLPSRVRYMRVDPESHKKAIFELESGRKAIYLYGEPDTASSLCGGVEFFEPKAMSVQRRMATNGKLYIEQPVFSAHEEKSAFADKQFHDDAQQMTSYEAVIGSLLSQAWQSWPDKLKAELGGAEKAFETIINNFPSEVAEETVAEITNSKNTLLLAKFLLAAQKAESVKELQEKFAEYAPNLTEDILYGGCSHVRIEDFLVSIVQQNVPSIKMKFCMVDPFGIEMTRSIVASLIRTPRYKVEIGLLSETPSYEALFESGELEKLNVDKFKRDAETSELPSDQHDVYDMLVLDRVLSSRSDRKAYLKTIEKLLVKTGFLLVVEYTRRSPVADAVQAFISQAAGSTAPTQLEHEGCMKEFDDAGFNVVAYQTDPVLWTTSYLLRRKYEPRQAKFINAENMQECDFVEVLKKETAEVYEKGAEHNIWLESKKVCDNGLLGLSMSMREEGPKDEIRVRCVTDLSLRDKKGANLNDTNTDMKKILSHDLLWNIYRDGKWGSIQTIQTKTSEYFAFKMTDQAYMSSTIRGDLSSLRWYANPGLRENMTYGKESDNPEEPPPVWKKCYVHYAPLNFRDVMIASGRLAPDAFEDLVVNPDVLLGLEYSGVLEDGRRVMGSMPSQCLSTEMLVDTRFILPVPDNMNLADAATIPIAYMTAYLALVIRGKIRFYQSVLIHSGSGAVGQAAIRIARFYRSKIYVTVGSETKRKMLQQKFPFLADDVFASSRTCEFENMIKRKTRGKGVDMVLNSLAEDKLRASVRCLARHGHFLEIGKYDLMKNSALGMECFMKDISFHGILLDSCWKTPMLIRMTRVIIEGIAEAVPMPFDHTIFPIDQAEEAFRFMASGKHTGKILLKVRDELPLRRTLGYVPLEDIQKVQFNAIHKVYADEKRVYLITGGLGGFGFELYRWLVKRGAKKVVLLSRRGIRSGYQGYYVSKYKSAGVDTRLCHEDITTAEGCERAIKFCLEAGPLGGIFHLAMVLRDTLLENQTVENFKESAAAKYWGTRHLDALTRKYCGPELEWFCCFSSQTAARGNSGQTAYGWSNSSMERIMEQRRHEGLPGQAIQWGAIGDVGVIIDNKGDNNTLINGLLPQRLPSCLQCLDMLMINNHPLCGLYVRPDADLSGKISKANVLETIANIVGIKDVSTMDLSAKLSDLGIDSLMGMEIVQMLERNYDIVLSMKDVRSLTLRDIRDMTGTGKLTAAEKAKKQDDANKQKLFTFNIRVDRSEITDDVYKMLVPMNEIVESPARRSVYFIHPIEGVAMPLKKLVGQLDSPVHCLQCTPDTPQDSIEDMATAYIQTIGAHRGELRSDDFHLVGYSYGAVVLYEIANQLAARGIRPSSITFIDSAPHYWKIAAERYKKMAGFDATKTLDEFPEAWPYLQAELISYMGNHYGVVDEAVKKEMLACKDTQERMDTMAKHLVSVENAFFTDIKFASFVCYTLWAKHLMADRYSTAKKKFSGDVNLIRTEHTLMEGLPDDYGLGEIVDGQIRITRIKGDHDSLVLGDESTQVAGVLQAIFQ